MNDPLKNLVNQILNYCIESSPDKMVCFFSEHRASSLLNYLYSLRKRYKRVDSIEEFWKLHDTEYLKNNVIYLIGESFPKTHWIIGAKKSYEISRLKEEYKKRGLKVMHYNWNELKFPLEQVPLTCLIRYSKKMMEKLSIVYILSALEEFARAGTIIIPPLDCIYQEDKMSMYLLWKKYLHQDVKMPDTIITKNLDEAFEFLEKKGMVVFKPIIGGLGKDVIKIDSIDHLQEIYERYQILYLQEYIESPGYDIRVIVIDGKIVAKYVRYNPKDFRHNIHMGGVGKRFNDIRSLDPKIDYYNMIIKKVVPKLVDLLRIPMMGLDFLPSKKGDLYLLEWNSTFGFKGAEETTNTNIAGQIVDYIIRKLEL